MRTRFLPNFSTAYRVGKALGAASLLTLVIENHKNSKANSEQKNRVIKPLNHTFSYDLNSVGYTFKFDNNNTTILLPYSFDLDQYSKALRAALIAKQAYEDCGENSPVEFNIYFADSSNGNTYYYFNNKLVKNIFVHLYLDVKKANFDLEVYATAGHEAIHSKHYHNSMRSFGIGFILANHVLSLLKNTKHSLLNHFPVHLLIICFLIKNLQEIDADLTSTKKLGTVEENIQHYKESAKWYKDEDCMYTDTDHPHPAIRLKLFQTFTSQYSSPLLFQGNRLSNIRQTQQKYNTNKEQLDELFLKFYGKNYKHMHIGAHASKLCF